MNKINKLQKEFDLIKQFRQVSKKYIKQDMNADFFILLDEYLTNRAVDVSNIIFELENTKEKVNEKMKEMGSIIGKALNDKC